MMQQVSLLWQVLILPNLSALDDADGFLTGDLKWH